MEQRKIKSTILHAPGCALLETSINQGQEGFTKFYIIFAEFFKESDRVHECPEVATPQQMKECTHQPCGSVVTETEDIELDHEYTVMPP